MEIKEVLPCIADPKKLRVIGRIDGEFPAVMPFLARLIANASYNEKRGWITFKRGQKIITIHDDGFVTMTQIKDEDEAKQILMELESKAKEAWEKREEIDLSKPLAKSVVGAMDVYAYLPKTNCKQCGEATCMAFAVKLLNGEISLKACKPLFENEKYRGLRETLVGMLVAAGYDIDL
ncbi:MAG: (Fe-S)-binding protein [Archaeoglobaceae archaeon]